MQKQDFFEDGYFYHVFNRGNNKENIFHEERNYIYFLSLVEKYLLPVTDIFSYCLLKNHFHFLLKIKEEKELPLEYLEGRKRIHQPFSNLFNAYTKAINKAYDRTGSLFQEHLHKNKVTTDEYLIQLMVYIHLNPVKHGFTNDFETYRYSSYKVLISKKHTHLKRDEAISWFDDRDNFIYWHRYNKIKYEGLIKEIEDIDY